MRAITQRYRDPLLAIWTTCAERIGFAIVATDDAYATTDGHGNIMLAHGAALDADDCSAQMILHELCHSLIQGHEGLTRQDWGLGNEDARDELREHACLRLQATLLKPFGLSRVLAPTTDFRAFYDRIENDPLAVSTSDELSTSDESHLLARLGEQRLTQAPWRDHIVAALHATRAVIEATAPFASTDDLLAALRPGWTVHASGYFQSPTESQTCGACAFFLNGLCQKNNAPVAAAMIACERFETELDCIACSACCREAFDVLEMSIDDAFVHTHRHLVVLRVDSAELPRAELPRPNGLCVCLTPAGTCATYADRPEPCRDFTQGSNNCAFARRRVGLSR